MTTVAGGFTRTFASLRNRNFRIFFTAQIVSVTGTWMQSLTKAWLIRHRFSPMTGEEQFEL